MTFERETTRRRPRWTRAPRLVVLIVCVAALLPLGLVVRHTLPQAWTDRRLMTASLRSSSRQPSSDVDDVVGLSNDFPSLEDTVEMARLSGLVYSFRGHEACNATRFDGHPILPPDLECHLYNHSHHQGTQVMILSSAVKQYIAVVYAGTDDLRTTLTDGDILMKPFGPLDENGDSILLPGPARVHAGFDNAVFFEGIFDHQLLPLLQKLLQKHPTFRLFTTGHSLGAADSILTAVALTQHMSKDVNISSLNFGCPNTGNWHWRTAVHSFPNLAVWRFVHGWDVVPRLPQYPFHHVGHTVQMNAEEMLAYYLHEGNKTLGYAGVPYAWEATPFIFIPGALWSHHIRRYQDYLTNQSVVDPDRYFVHEFERIDNSTSTDDDDDMATIDDDVLPPIIWDG